VLGQYAEKTISLCLKSLSVQTIPRTSYELIVVDDGSTDKTQAISNKFENVKLIYQFHAGPAKARNLGVAKAKGEIVLFLDADCVPKIDWIEKMTVPFSQQDIVGVKGRYMTNQKSLVARFVQLEYEDKYDRMARQKYIDFVDTYSAGYRRDVFIANKGFDSVFSTSSVEDQEFSFRLARQGLLMVFEPEAIVYHLGHADSLFSYFRKKFKIGYWKIWVHQIHPDKLIADSHTPQVLKMQIILAGLSSVLIILGIFDFLFIILGTAGIVIFFITTVPFLNKAFNKDKLVASVSPCLLLCRAIALGLGLVAGFFSFMIRSLRKCFVLDNRE